MKEGKAPEDGAAGILWIAIAFAGTLALGRTFERERQSETLRALLLAPAPRPAIYVGKLLGIIALLVGGRGRAGAAGGVAVPGAAASRIPFWLAAIIVTRHVGFAAVGTLFAAMLVRARSRDVLLPVLLYPITVPVIIAGVRATAALLQPDVDVAIVRFWMALLLALRRGVRDAGALDVRTADDGLSSYVATESGVYDAKWFMPAPVAD